MSDGDSWNDGPYLVPDSPDDSCPPQHEVRQLQQELRQQQMRIETLQVLLVDAYERVEERNLRRGMLVLELELHQDALREKLREARELACTIKTQNGLLGLAWVDSQRGTSSWRKRKRDAVLLHDYEEETSAAEEAEASARKKRRLGP